MSVFRMTWNALGHPTKPGNYTIRPGMMLSINQQHINDAGDDPRAIFSVTRFEDLVD